MGDHMWFEIEDPSGLTAGELAFLAALRVRLAPSVGAGVEIRFGRPEVGGPMVVTLTVNEPGVVHRLIGMDLEVGVDRVRGGWLNGYGGPVVEAVGTVDELARRSADWFRSELDRPVLLYTWLNDSGRPYAVRCLFADTGRTVSQTYDARLAPPGQAEELTAAGQVIGRELIRTSALPAPTHYRHLRGSSAAVAPPPGVPEDAAADGEREAVGGSWYDDEPEPTEFYLLVCDDVPYDVVLLDPGARPLEVAKVLRAVVGGGLWGAKQAVTGERPVVLLDGLREDEAEQVAGRLRAAGASVEVRPRAVGRPA
ncbi:ribosomal protein L7/L12 [Kitasatospora sp. NPDC048365]|uniref:ribosomal protein L7/L12 n=1 Tax=Kitasatospora sp. NPDC048365 TaxID=3364050 RepID=UPI00371BDC6A